MEPRAMIGRNLDTCKRGPPANEINGLGTSWGTQWGVGCAGNGKHIHTQCLP